MTSPILSVLYALHTAFGGYNLYLDSISISKLQQYEESTKKAVKSSNIAESLFHKIRLMQASGTLVVVLTLVQSTLLIFPSPLLLARLVSTVSSMFSLLVAREQVRALLESKAEVAVLAAMEQVRAFFESQAKLASIVMLLAVREQVEAFGQAEVAIIVALLAARKRVAALSELKAKMASLVARLAAFEQAGAFLEGKSKVPLPELGEYIEAISNGLDVRRNMAYMLLAGQYLVDFR